MTHRAEADPSPRSRILLIDNDADVSQVVRTFLGKSGGFDVEVELDGRDGLARIASEEAAGRPFQVVFLDLRMPGLSGMQVLDSLQTREPAPFRGRIVVVSGFIDETDRRELAASPLVHAVVKKPFDLFDLLRIAREACDQVEQATAAHAD